VHRVIDTGIDPTPDVDDQDFRHWTGLLNPPKIVDARDFNGGVSKPVGLDGTATERMSPRSLRAQAREGRRWTTTGASSASLPTRSSQWARRSPTRARESTAT
jgi:hypothetical protein